MRPNLSASSWAYKFLNKVPIFSMQTQCFNKFIMFFISPPPIIDIRVWARLYIIPPFIIFRLTHLSFGLRFVYTLLIEELIVKMIIILSLLVDVSLNFFIWISLRMRTFWSFFLLQDFVRVLVWINLSPEKSFVQDRSAFQRSTLPVGSSLLSIMRLGYNLSWFV